MGINLNVMNIIKQAEKNTKLLTIEQKEKNFVAKFKETKKEVSLLNDLNNELKTLKDNKEVTNKFFIEHRKLIRLQILSINTEILKTTKKEDLKKVIINKVATEKQSNTIGVNKLVQLEKRSLGSCLSVLNKVYEDVKNEPNKIKEFISKSYRVNKLTLNYEEINTTYKVKFCPILSDIISFARKNSELYSFISLLFTDEELTKLTERKVLNVISSNLPKLQEIKAKIKESLRLAKVKK